MTTNLLTVLFGENQPYSEARTIPCDIVLEIVEMKLDERLSVLDEDKERLARKELAIIKEFGSVAAFSKEILSKEVKPPKV